MQSGKKFELNEQAITEIDTKDEYNWLSFTHVVINAERSTKKGNAL